MMNRREFAASLAAWPITQAKTNRPYRTALIGCGWWGMNILREALAAGFSTVAGMCDVDDNQIAPAAAEVEKLTGARPVRYRDYRELLHKERPEIAIVATPDHWHALCTIAAVKAGAHVYVEKPIGHTIREGRAMVQAAREAGRTVQVGTHRRVSPHNVSAMEFLRSGKLGQIGMVRAFVHYGGGPGQKTADSDPPPGLDWNFWCGPAPYRPFNKAIHPRGFRQFLDYANGQIGDWGIHWMDQILWWAEEKYPKVVFSSMARRIKQDSSDAPDTQVATYQFESFTAVWEHRLYAANDAEKSNIGCYFYGTEGTLHVGWLDGWTFHPADRKKEVRHEAPVLHTKDNHNIEELWANFLNAIRFGHRPACDIEIGHRSTNMSLLGMISARLGRSIQWDGEREEIAGDPEANRLLSRPYRSPWVYPS
jgi:predicted dehydrogenase